jgi:hypothetical protein
VRQAASVANDPKGTSAKPLNSAVSVCHRREHVGRHCGEPINPTSTHWRAYISQFDATYGRLLPQPSGEAPRSTCPHPFSEWIYG